MATKKKRSAGRKQKKGVDRQRVATKRAAPKRHSSARRRHATGSQGVRKKRILKNRTIRRKERKVEKAMHRLIDAEKELAVEELGQKAHPATQKRGADPPVPSKSNRKRSNTSKEQKLEQGLEESMAGSDPISITQPATPIAEKPKKTTPR
jgi:hypothetical protein